jgi:hypothetical protein
MPALYLDGDPVQDVEDDTVRVSLEFGWDTCTGYRCTACGGDLTETTDGFETDDADGQLCPDYDPTDHDPGNEPDDNGDGDGPEYGKGPHVPARVPLSWVNSAAIDTDEKDDSVTVSISVGDPRGAFCFTVRRIPDDADGELSGRLVLHVPYPGEPLPHRPLTEHHTGTYLVG